MYADEGNNEAREQGEGIGRVGSVESLEEDKGSDDGT